MVDLGLSHYFNLDKFHFGRVSIKNDYLYLVKTPNM